MKIYIFPFYKILLKDRALTILFILQPPVPIECWNGTYNATTDGPVCPQPTEEVSSEDCLILNVYTTKVCISLNSFIKDCMLIYFLAS